MIGSKVYFGLIAMALTSIVGCDGRKEKAGDGVRKEAAGKLGMDFRTNRMVNLPGDVYRQAGTSPVFWQPWTKASLDEARSSGKLILAMLISPKCPDYDWVLRDIDDAPDLVKIFNNDYQPILIDVSATREMAVLAVELCSETKINISFPLMVWFSPDGDPLAWFPAYGDASKSFSEKFYRSHNMIDKMWTEDPQYITENSRLSHALRRERMEKEVASQKCSEAPAEDSLKALRQLTSLYDAGSRSFDGIGRNFPSGVLNLLATVVSTDSIPSDIREKSESVLGMLVEDLLVSPMFDPLDGGIFSSKRGTGWELPFFNRNSATQAQAVCALLNVYEASGDKRVLAKASAALLFMEKEYETHDGLFCLGAARNIHSENWLWRMSEISELLDPEEQRLWVSASGMKEMGNIPADVDPERKYFRQNTIGLRKTIGELAAESGWDDTSVTNEMEIVRDKLLKARQLRTGKIIDATDANCEASLNIVQVYAAFYRATGDDQYRQKAVELLRRVQERFFIGPELQLFAGGHKKSLVAGRAYLYALAMQAVLDVAGITLDEELLLLADDLATTTGEIFSTGDYLRECPPAADILKLPISDKLLILNESTKELLSIAESRMQALGRPMLESFASLASSLPTESTAFPNLYIGIIRGAIIREHSPVIVYGEEISDEMRNAISRTSLTAVRRDMALALLEDQMEADEVLLINPQKNVKRIKNAADISSRALRN
ncbi:DUF255 domain-containing protein [Luteolibacter algae]|uniref:DUF255 domain-containing protein n=1 Tax=Luteolibacter algae TaxID=454151 RepID=A0ABW5D985_9BACT